MKVSIYEIENSKDQPSKIEFSEIIEEFNKSVPVKARLTVTSLDKKYINVAGEVHATLNLNCDNCFKEFKKDFSLNIDETFVKDCLFDDPKDEIELKEGSFVEELHGSDEINITDLIYQSVILYLPNKLVCDINCIGDEKIAQYVKKDFSDPRLDIFKSIKIEKDI